MDRQHQQDEQDRERRIEAARAAARETAARARIRAWLRALDGLDGETVDVIVERLGQLQQEGGRHVEP